MAFLQYYLGYKSFWCLVFVYLDISFDNAFIERMPFLSPRFYLKSKEKFVVDVDLLIASKKIYINPFHKQAQCATVDIRVGTAWHFGQQGRNSGMQNNGEIETKAECLCQ